MSRRYRLHRNLTGFLLTILAAAILSACAPKPPEQIPEKKATPPRIGEVVTWGSLPGWETDNLAEAWPALLQSCRVMPKRDPEWTPICDAAKSMGTTINDKQARGFFQQWFEPHPMLGENDNPDGLITGYYEPLLHGSFTPDERYRYPLYGPPEDLLTIDLGSVYPELKNMRLRGRLAGRKVIPYYDRAEIDRDDSPLLGHELLWLDDPVAVFFLHVQGSGRVQLPDGSLVGVGYANQNGFPYRSIGKTLIEKNAIPREKMSLFAIKRWLAENPQQAKTILDSNPSYVFFRLRENAEEPPPGSLGVPLTPERSIAVDRTRLPLGSPVWLSTRLPGAATDYNRLMLAQDTGGAIKGQVRADLFFGTGDRAEQLAGGMKQAGRMFVLVPRVPSPPARPVTQAAQTR